MITPHFSSIVHVAVVGHFYKETFGKTTCVPIHHLSRRPSKIRGTPPLYLLLKHEASRVPNETRASAERY